MRNEITRYNYYQAGYDLVIDSGEAVSVESAIDYCLDHGLFLETKQNRLDFLSGTIKGAAMLLENIADTYRDGADHENLLSCQRSAMEAMTKATKHFQNEVENRGRN